MGGVALQVPAWSATQVVGENQRVAVRAFSDDVERKAASRSQGCAVHRRHDGPQQHDLGHQVRPLAREVRGYLRTHRVADDRNIAERASVEELRDEAGVVLHGQAVRGLACAAEAREVDRDRAALLG